MIFASNFFNEDTEDLSLKAEIIPWDTDTFGAAVADIKYIKVHNSNISKEDFRQFEKWREHQCILISCRLNHNELKESMVLEEIGFRFIEMVLHPIINDLSKYSIPSQSISIAKADLNDLDEIREIACSVFRNERIFVDHRIANELNDLRYAQWVTNSVTNPHQSLVKICEGNSIVAFFIYEILGENTVYWHLTAVSPQYHGKGYGFRVWLAMIDYHRRQGCSAISTTISARNIPVLNLYSKLNFRFLPPKMTFHWVKN